MASEYFVSSRVLFTCEEFGDLPGTLEANGMIVYSFT